MLDELNCCSFIKGGETYLVTGGNGFIGSSFVFRLVEINKLMRDTPCKIIIAARNYKKLVELFGDILYDENVEVIICENKDELIVKQKIDWIVCAGAATSKPYFAEFPVDTLWDNMSGIYHCLKLAKSKEVKGILFMSSVQVYGAVNDKKISEDSFGALDCMCGDAVYPESKRIGEMLCWSFFKEYGVPAKCVRFFHVYGENEQQNKGTFLSDFINHIIDNKNIIIKGNGQEIRNLCYIDDAVNAAFLVLHRGKSGEAYNVGSEANNYSIREIAELLCSITTSLGRECRVIIQNNDIPSVVKNQIPDLRKIKSLGWREIRGDFEANMQEIIKKYV